MNPIFYYENRRVASMPVKTRSLNEIRRDLAEVAAMASMMPSGDPAVDKVLAELELEGKVAVARIPMPMTPAEFL